MCVCKSVRVRLYLDPWIVFKATLANNLECYYVIIKEHDGRFHCGRVSLRFGWSWETRMQSRPFLTAAFCHFNEYSKVKILAESEEQSKWLLPNATCSIALRTTTRKRHCNQLEVSRTYNALEKLKPICFWMKVLLMLSWDRQHFSLFNFQRITYGNEEIMSATGTIYVKGSWRKALVDKGYFVLILEKKNRSYRYPVRALFRHTCLHFSAPKFKQIGCIVHQKVFTMIVMWLTNCRWAKKAEEFIKILRKMMANGRNYLIILQTRWRYQSGLAKIGLSFQGQIFEKMH